MDPKSPHYHDKIHIDLLMDIVSKECSRNGEIGYNWGEYYNIAVLTNIFHHRMHERYLLLIDIFDILDSSNTAKMCGNANRSLKRVKYKLKQVVGMVKPDPIYKESEHSE